jgi:hypothetical protein
LHLVPKLRGWERILPVVTPWRSTPLKRSFAEEKRSVVSQTSMDAGGAELVVPKAAPPPSPIGSGTRRSVSLQQSVEFSAILFCEPLSSRR